MPHLTIASREVGEIGTCAATSQGGQQGSKAFTATRVKQLLKRAAALTKTLLGWKGVAGSRRGEASLAALKSAAAFNIPSSPGFDEIP